MADSSLRVTVRRDLDRLLSEDPESARVRQERTFDREASPFGHSLLLYGAGGLGRKVLAGLRKAGIAPLAFVDRNASLQGTRPDGLDVLSPEEAVARYGHRAVFVVTIFNPGCRFTEIRDQLVKSGATRVLSIVSLLWKHPQEFLPYYCIDLPQKLLARKDEVRSAAEVLADDASRQEYLHQVRWRLWQDFDALGPVAQHDQYFPDDLFALSPEEVFVDGGAFDGDTVQALIAHARGRFRSIVAIEPDPRNHRKLVKFLDSARTSSHEVSAWPLALGEKRGTVHMDGVGSSAAVTGAGPVETPCMPLDELPWSQPPTYIKLDIEGAECDALRGGSRTIRRHLPVLAICAYHRQEHLWEVPLLIRSLSPEYSIFLRPHAEVWELVYYAVPAGRLLPQPPQGDSCGRGSDR